MQFYIVETQFPRKRIEYSQQLFQSLSREITKILRKSAVPKDNRKRGRAMLNLTDKNKEKTSRELYIQRLGITALKKNTTTEGIKKE